MAEDKSYFLPLPEIIGLPPDSYVSHSLIRNSMPTLELTPCSISKESAGLNLFTLEDGWKVYEPMLNSYGYYNKRPIKAAFLMEGLPTDSFTNEYGDSFFDSMTDIVSSKTAEVAQILGGRTVGGMIQSVATKLSQAGEYGAMIGGAIDYGLDQARKLQDTISGLGGPGQFLAKTINVLGSLGAGARLDFPMIWKSSGYSPSYSFTIRLYNPNPADIVMHKTFIVGPLAALLLMVLPIVQEDGYSYQWPFFHRIKCKGLFNLDPAFITGMTVIKGGEQGLIGYTQRPNLIDVRFEAGSLYRTIVANDENVLHSTQRPTLGNYLSDIDSDTKTIEESTIDTFFRAQNEFQISQLNQPLTSQPTALVPGPSVVPPSSTSSSTSLEGLVPNRVPSGDSGKLTEVSWD